MQNKISVVIPTYKEPEYLDLCLQSLFEGQSNENEVIVVIDGFMEMNQYVIDKYKGNPGFRYIDLGENMGLQQATNTGVWMASNDLILIVNDDNVFPSEWDAKLEGYEIKEFDVVTPNQMEPYASIYKSFVHKDCGQTPDTFDPIAFAMTEWVITSAGQDGSTLPIFMHKKTYMMVGGWDIWFDSPHICDWDFWLKLELAGCNFTRVFDCVFYHFGGRATKQSPYDPEQWNQREQYAAQQFQHKWGFIPRQDINNRKSPLNTNQRGIQF